MKKIWIDGYEANVKQRLGSSKVAFELLVNFERFDRENSYTILLPMDPLGDLPKERPGWHYRVVKFRRFWTYFTLPFILMFSNDKPDLFFSPTHYIPRFTSVKRIGMIFDTSYLHFPKMFNKEDLWKLTSGSLYTIKNAIQILTISNFSKKDLIKNYPIVKNKVKVVYPGYDANLYKVLTDTAKISEIQNKYSTGDKYLIYIGTIQPRKNLERLIEAFSLLSSDKAFDKVKLVLVGKTTGPGRKGWMYEQILRKPLELGIENRVIFTGYIPDADLVYLLNGATSLILPSLWEGFGIPVLDSMACKTPVIASNVSSLPEIIGEAGVLVDPYSIEQISQGIRLVLTDKKIREKISQLGLKRISKFSWQSMAKEIIKIFNNL